jgi:transposase
LPIGFRLAQYDLALRRFLRLSELAIGDDYGAAIPAPRRSALRASQGPSICRAATYLAMLSWRYKGPKMEVTTVGIDLAKNVFRLHGCDARGRAVLRKQLGRRQLLAFVARLPRCVVAMEACASAHYWAREIEKLGHRVRLINPRFVRPYVKANKSLWSDRL